MRIFGQTKTTYEIRVSYYSHVMCVYIIYYKYVCVFSLCVYMYIYIYTRVCVMGLCAFCILFSLTDLQLLSLQHIIPMEMRVGLWNAIKNRLEKPRGLDNGSNALLERETIPLSISRTRGIYTLLEFHLSLSLSLLYPT